MLVSCTSERASERTCMTLHLPKLAAVCMLGSVSRVGGRELNIPPQGERAEPCTDSELELQLTSVSRGRAEQHIGNRPGTNGDSDRH